MYRPTYIQAQSQTVRPYASKLNPINPSKLVWSTDQL